MNFHFKRNIKFDGTKEIETKNKNKRDNIIARRFKILMGFVVCVAFIFIAQMFSIQIKNENYYETKLNQYNTDTLTADTFRGNIYDRDGTRLVYNKNVSCATYYAVKNIKKDEIDFIVKFLIDNIDIDISKVSTRDKKDYLVLKDSKFVDSLVTKEEIDRYKNEDDYNNLIYNLKLSRITDEILEEQLSEYDIKYYKLYYAIKNTLSGSIILEEGLSVVEASIIGENANILRGIKVTNDWVREYTYEDNFNQVLGRVTTKKQGIPANMKEQLLALDYENDSRVGTSGVEAQYENILTGVPATYSIKYDAKGNPNVVIKSDGEKGDNIRLTIDWDIQTALSEAIEEELRKHNSYEDRYNNNIFVTMMDPNTGDIIAMAGKQRDSKSKKIYDFAAGNYLFGMAMGSTVKGATIYTAFKNNIIKENTYFYDAPIKIAGTKEMKSHKNMGNINEITALAQSSNVYMFHVAIKLGGGIYRYGEPLNINLNAFNVFRKDFGELGLGVKTGIDLPYEELGFKDPDPNGGQLLHFAIGQSDTYTTLQMAQYVSAIANGGKRIQPHLFLESFNENSDGDTYITSQNRVRILDDVSEYSKAIKRIQKGFRECILSGTGKSVNGYYQPAGKTGTAQYIDTKTGVDYPNHLFIGYAPYYKPQVSVACAAERQKTNTGESCKPLAKKAFELYFAKYGVKSE